MRFLFGEIMNFIGFIFLGILSGVVQCQSPILTVKAVLNGTAFLPCDISSPAMADHAILVVWYSKELMPIYSYDIREGNPQSSSHWKDETLLGNRAFFRTITQPATLTLNAVGMEDEGAYRCRVDFLRSPTRNSRVNLEIILPPEKPVILDEYGSKIDTTAGPYEEGTDVKLMCKVVGGKPSPVVRWWKEELLLESFDTPAADTNVKYRQVILKNVNRTDLHKSFACQTSNNNMNPPLFTYVQLDLYLKPINVSIVQGNEPLSASREYQILCKAVGSRPQAAITWWKGGLPLQNFRQEDTDDENVSLSALTYRPTLQDQNQTLTCRAVNPKIPSFVTETTFMIDVSYAPMLKLDLGSNMNGDDIEEGDDVYFECKIAANPPAYKVEWIHNDKAVPRQDEKSGIIASHKVLILQRVKRHMAGNYTCFASSVEGDGISNTVELKIKYKPFCETSQKIVYGVMRGETARVQCQVSAVPAPTNFKWEFNHTNKPISEARYTSTTEGLSILTFTPHSELDYGILMCWGINSVGQQDVPCMFHVIPTGRPESPRNCSVTNQTTDSIELACVEGFDGGQEQRFVLEVMEPETDALLANVTSHNLHFKIDRLTPGKSLKINVYASNVRGNSDYVVMLANTLDRPLKQIDLPYPLNVSPLISGISATFIIISGSIAFLLFLRSGRCRRKRSRFLNPGGIVTANGDANGGIDAAAGAAAAAAAVGNDVRQRVNEAVFQRPSGGNSYEIVEKTPDLVKCNNGEFNFQNRPLEARSNTATMGHPFGHEKLMNAVRDEFMESYATLKLKHKVRHPRGRKEAEMKNEDGGVKEPLLMPPHSPTPTPTPTGATVRSERREKLSETAVTSKPPYYREVITVCPPFLPNEPESCV